MNQPYEHITADEAAAEAAPDLSRRRREATEESTEPRRYREPTEETTQPRRYREPTEETTQPRRHREPTEESTQPRRHREPTEESTQPRRHREPTEETTQPRRHREPTEESTQPRRHREPTEESTQPRRGEDSDGSVFSQVFSRVKSSPDLSGFYEKASCIKSMTGESGGQYTVKRVLNQEGGESIILLCANEGGEDVVAKVFVRAEGKGKHSLAAREKVFSFMQTEAGKRTVLAVSDYGTVSLEPGFENYFEIMPYCSGGDLLNVKFTFDQLVPIIRELNDSLNAIHQAGIIHLDIKPENLYRQGDRIVIGDFGISRTTEKAHTYTSMGTDGYRAPETVLAPTAGKAAYVLGPYCDYYSFGVTLACLYEGCYIFADADPSEITHAIMNSHMPLSYHDDPRQDQLQRLIDGLVQYDYHRRFKYEDVVSWLNDHNYTGAQADDIWPKTFPFNQKKLKDEQQLFSALTASPDTWEEGKYFLYSKTFEDFFRSFRPDLSRTAQLLEEQYRTGDQDMGLAHFLKALYLPGHIVWRGYNWQSLAELADKMIHTSQVKSYSELLQKRVVSHWLEKTTGIIRTQENLALVQLIEEAAQTHPELACYWFGYAFAEKKELDIHGKSVNSLRKLFSEIFRSPKVFYEPGNAYSQLIDPVQGAKVYGFICSFGHWEKIKKTLSQMRGSMEYEKYQMVMALIESIGREEQFNMSWFETFYLTYGPMAAVYYVYNTQREKHIYKGLNAVGNSLINDLENAAAPAPCSISECRSKMQNLVGLVSKLEQQLQNNPFLAEAGVYENASIACSNLSGYFAYNLMGKRVPLGLASLIENCRRERTHEPNNTART